MLAWDQTKGGIESEERGVPLRAAEQPPPPQPTATAGGTKALAGAGVAELREALRRVSEERDRLLKLGGQESAQLRARLGITLSDQERLQEELAVLRSELATRTSQRDAALLCTQKLTLEGASLAAELHTIRGELKMRGAENAQLLAQVDELRCGLERVTVELSEARVRLVQAECQLPLEPPASTRFPDLPGTSQTVGTASAAIGFSYLQVPENDEPPAQGAASFFDSAEAADFFGSSPFEPSEELPGEPVFFLLRPGLGSMEYNSADQVVELYQSINFSHVSAEGRGQENCKGFVCCLRKNGERKIFTALEGVESGKTWVYLPERQPADEAAYPRFLKEALRFAEEVGFLMEPVLSGVTPLQHREMVARCPVLKPARRPRLSETASAVSGL